MILATILISFALVILNTAGQLLLKRASEAGGLFNVDLWGGYFLFLVSVGVSFFLMRILDLKFFTTIMSLNYVAVMLASAYFFKEPLTPSKIGGTALVLCGVIVFVGIG
jgi:multidrug transporter EmrE-like cation transporter